MRISNPLGDDTSVMRTSMLPSMLKIAARNSSRGVAEAKVFECAYVYLPSDNEGELPEERRMVSGFSYGTDKGPGGYYETKAALEELFKVLGIRSYSFEPETENPSMHPGRTASIVINGKTCGIIGIIHPDVADNFDAPSNTCIFDIEANALINAAKTLRTYKQLPRFPGITRDLAVICGSEVTVAQIIKTAKSAGGKYLKDCKLFDVYQDEKLGTGFKSVAISLEFRADDRTLADDDVKPAVDKIVEELKKRYDAKLRQ